MPARKSSSRKTSGRRAKTSSSARGRSKKSSGRKYSPKAQQEVHKEMRHMKQGRHKNPKQAIAIGLSKARQEGARVPPPPARSKSAQKQKKAA